MKNTAVSNILSIVVDRECKKNKKIKKIPTPLFLNSIQQQ